MYADHVPIINAAMRASPAVFERGCMFAILSARTQFIRVPEQMQCVRKRGDKSPALWGWKFESYTYLRENAAHIHKLVMAQRDTAAALGLLCAVPGLGIVKGAFVLQMLGHDVACLDVRNIKRANLDPLAYRSRKADAGPNYMRRKIDAYIAETHGRAAELWDTWCEDVAGSYGIPADKISEMHLTAIVPKAMRAIVPVQPIRGGTLAETF